MERLAVPLFGEDVAPRFSGAHEALLVDEIPAAEGQGRRAGPAWTVPLQGESWMRRLEHLHASGATVVLCGGFNRRFRPLAEEVGLRVECGLIGRATDLVAAFFADELDQHRLMRAGPGEPGLLPDPDGSEDPGHP
jgi:hypothetical protein